MCLLGLFHRCISPQFPSDIVAGLPTLLARQNEIEISMAEHAVNPALSGSVRIVGLA
jgi:hypothetical protein